MEEQASQSKHVWMTPELTVYGKIEEITAAKCKILNASDDFEVSGIQDALGQCGS
jgi:hypothetical protein